MLVRMRPVFPFSDGFPAGVPSLLGALLLGITDMRLKKEVTDAP